MSYAQTASVYDAIYTRLKSYSSEAKAIAGLVRQHLLTELPPRTELNEAMGLDNFDGLPLLDVACGTGRHLVELAVHGFSLAGIDLDEAMLDIARQNLRTGLGARAGFGRNLSQGDMCTFDLGRRFNVVTCLFSAIGHLTYEQLPQAIANMARHLAPGGLLLIEPWILPHMFEPDHLGFIHVDRPDLKVARVSRTTRQGNVTTLVLDHLVGRLSGVETFTETHVITMFTEDEFIAAFRAAGLEVWRDEQGINSNGRGLFIGRKPL
jgi:dTDP-3-amino-3,4,6-trideoxy-alpha-D-glucopyranose N,N-dimethyltransferase